MAVAVAVGPLHCHKGLQGSGAAQPQLGLRRGIPRAAGVALGGRAQVSSTTSNRHAGTPVPLA